MEAVLDGEEEDIQNDPVRREHFSYNEYSAIVNGAPEIFLDAEGSEIAKELDFAPGEGKKPSSYLDMKDWDHKSWPCLLPDGKFGLNHERKVKRNHGQAWWKRGDWACLGQLQQNEGG